MTELARRILGSDDFAILGHVNPDGDTIGCCIALALALESKGKRAFVYLPGGMPVRYSAFSCSAVVCDINSLAFEPKCAIAVDVSEQNRMGDGQAIFDRCARQFLIDHHPTNLGFGERWIVDGDAAACAEPVMALLEAMDVKLSREMAEWLFIALSTDSGRFGFSSTRPETLEAAADCVRAGIDVDAINRALYCSRSEGKTRLLGLVLSCLQMSEDRRVCWSRLTQDMLRQANALREDADGIVNYLIEIIDVRCAFLAEERGSVTKFSLRSKPGMNVAEDVAVPLGGGGHKCAAGVTLEMGLEEACQIVLDRIRRVL